MIELIGLVLEMGIALGLELWPTRWRVNWAAALLVLGLLGGIVFLVNR